MKYLFLRIPCYFYGGEEDFRYSEEAEYLQDSVADLDFNVTATTKTVVFLFDENKLIQYPIVKLYGIHPDLPKLDQTGKDALKEVNKTVITDNNLVKRKVINGECFKNIFLELDRPRIREAEATFVSDRVVYIDLTLDLSETKNLDLYSILDYYRLELNSYNNTGGFMENNEKTTQGKENKKMLNNVFNGVRVGKAGSNYKLSMFGTIAFKGKTYVNDGVQVVDELSLDLDMIYAIPTNQITAGDIVEVDGEAYYVLESKDNEVSAINLNSSKKETLVPKNVFGMKMFTKIVNPLNGMNANINSTTTNGMANNNAFMSMLMMQSLLGDNDKASDKNAMLMMMMMGNNPFMNFGVNQAKAENKSEDK